MKRARQPRLLWTILWLTMTLALSPHARARIIYIDDDAAVGGDGTSWATAYRFLRYALPVGPGASQPVEVRVAQGLYKPDRHPEAPGGTGDRTAVFELADGVSLLGGYAGVGASDPNARDFEAYETVLSGDLAGNDAEVTDPALLRDDPTRDENAGYVVFIHKAQVRLEGVTITGGTAGGAYLGIYPWEGRSDVTISDCTFYGNRGSGGHTPMAGALSVQGSPGLTVVRCLFRENAGWVGALRAGDVLVRHCRFERNYSWDVTGGGGAGFLSGNSTASDCVFTSNRAERMGGALVVSPAGSNVAKLLRCEFRGNLAGECGGAVVCDGNVDVEECVFVGNEAGMRGGAGCDWPIGVVRMRRCLLIGNRVGERGGAWGSYARSSLELFGCTVVGNRAPKGAFLEAVYDTEKNPSHVTIRNCVLSNGDDEIWSDATPVDIAYTCLGGEGGVSAEPNDWLVLGAGNIAADPCLVDPGYWDANGTPDDPNDDFFVAGDYHLKSQAGRWDEVTGNWVQDDVTSLCIDAGDPNSPIGHEPFPNGGVINMGAYGGTTEASKSYFGKPPCEAIIAGDINGDCRVDLADVIILLDHWLQSGEDASE